MSVGDVIQLRVVGDYLGQEWQNVFYYRQTAGAAAGAGACLNLFEDEVMDNVLATMLDSSTVLSLSAVNGMNNSDQYSRPPDPGFEQGTLDALTLGESPSNAAVGFRSNRNGIGTRYSYKRFAGVPLSWIAGNAWAVASDAAHLALANALGLSLSGFGYGFDPVQVTGGFKLGEVPTVSFALTSWLRIDRMSTQNTRTEGRGA